ncbi:autophagy-related protein 9 [Dioscorea cayenensis subsp. rotundata]|uniref:Autophagy-related protein 9 n=1 Tax=Dioscorea cayennensis subsp. rotundata TaxID=55577 RepID=A0AB40C4M5_DIOCR|nr:autophagy-related protein 9 [Dioscorea cayenensis subsp. rotundata]XP_039134775.1 autophagy-related protein 9 [Dioscorea cayenensis subsp. rotundata]
MMSGIRRDGTAPSRFRWQWPSGSSLNTHLLKDVPPEIELSDYQRLPQSGNESPSGLLNGDGLEVESIADLDLFFERLYSYHREKGLRCIIIKWIFEILTVIFVTCFIGFCFLVINWNYLWNAKCGIDAFESGNRTCDLAKEAFNQHPLAPFTITKGIIIGSMALLTFHGVLNFLQFIVQFQYMVKIRKFYYNSLKVTDLEIQTTSWQEILDKVVRLQESQKICVVKDLSAHDVMMRIMRKENYLIGMLNKGVLAFSIPWWVPGAGPTVNSRSNGRQNRLILTKAFEWVLNWCIFQSMFDSKFCIRRDYLANPSLLRKRLMVIGVVIFILSPCLVIFMLVYLFLRHAEQFYHHPSTASSRRWSNLAKWIFREFNEVDHLFKHRMNNSVVHASNYLKQFPSPLVTIIAKFISFVSGGFAAILIIIAILDESLLEGHIYGRNLFWYAAVFGTVTAISRALVSDELQVLDQEGAMSLVVQHTHYMPKRWRGKANSDLVRKEFENLFQYTGMLLLEEMASIFVTPYLLIFVLPKHVDDILRFISDFTVDIEGVGHVCSLSVFDFECHGNRKYGSPCDAPREKRSSQGKMEKSFLSFHSAYPSWEPNSQGQQFLSTLRSFREKQMHRMTYQDYSVNQANQFTPVLGGHGELAYRPVQDGVHQTGYNLGTLWMINVDQRTHPYLLDWYYVSPPSETVQNLNDIPLSSGIGLRQHDDPWQPDNHLQIDPEDNWGLLFSDRMQSHSGASTSSPFLTNSILHHQNPSQSHLEASMPSPFLRDSILNHQNPRQHDFQRPWWARTGPDEPHSLGPPGSFLEPAPFIGHHNFSHHSDDLSNKSVDESQHDGSGDGGSADPKSLSKTYYMEDSDKTEGFHRPYVDSYGPPLKTLPVRILPRSIDPV